MVTTQENKEQNICAIHVIIRKATQGWPPSAATRPSRTTRADSAKIATTSHIIRRNLRFIKVITKGGVMVKAQARSRTELNKI